MRASKLGDWLARRRRCTPWCMKETWIERERWGVERYARRGRRGKRSRTASIPRLFIEAGAGKRAREILKNSMAPTCFCYATYLLGALAGDHVISNPSLFSLGIEPFSFVQIHRTRTHHNCWQRSKIMSIHRLWSTLPLLTLHCTSLTKIQNIYIGERSKYLACN